MASAEMTGTSSLVSEAWETVLLIPKIVSKVVLSATFKQSIHRFLLVWTKTVKIQTYKHQSAVTCPSQVSGCLVSTLGNRRKPPPTRPQTALPACKSLDVTAVVDPLSAFLPGQELADGAHNYASCRGR